MQMRIVCQKCSAAYAVDDKLLTPKGVRAQCPKCRNLQLVKKEDAPSSMAPSPFLAGLASPKPPAAAAGPFAGISGPPAIGSPTKSEASYASTPFAAARSTSVAPVNNAAPFAFDFSEPPAAPSAAPMRFDELPLPNKPSVESAPSLTFDDAPLPFQNVGSSENRTAGKSVAQCTSCKKSMTDPFDIALGTCDDCRHKVEKATADEPRAPDSDAGRIERVDVNAFSSEPSPALELQERAPTKSDAPPASVPKPNISVQSAQRDSAKSKKPLFIALGALVAATGIGLAITKPWVKKAAPTATKINASTKATDGVIDDWSKSNPQVKDESKEETTKRLAYAETLLSKDTESAYREAAREFQKVIVAQPNNDAAISGWVLAEAFGAGSKMTPSIKDKAEKLLAAAEKRGPAPRIFVAHAHLRLAANELADVKVFADQGKRSPVATERALASLAAGYTLLTKNPLNAESEFREALVLDPKLKRVHLFLADLAITQGHYKEAVAQLEKRLELDADQTTASRQLARLLLDVGERAKAKTVLTNALKQDRSGTRATIDAAVFAYQHENQLDEALATLDGLAVDADVDDDDQIEMQLHRSHILRMKGLWQEAVAAAERTLEKSPDDIDAKFAKILAQLDGGRVSDARLAFDALKPQLAGDVYAAPLEARLLLLEKKPAEAFALFKSLTQENARPLDVLMAGAAAAQMRKDGSAWELCLKKATTIDLFGSKIESMTRRFIRPIDLGKEIIGSWDKLRADRNEDPNPEMCEGILAWHLQNVAAAEQRFAKVNNIDPQNANAWAYRSLASLERGDTANAQKFSKRAIGASSVSPWAHLAQAKLLMALKKPDFAKTDADLAMKLMPTLLSARTLAAEVDAINGSKEQALRGLTTVLLVDPNFRPAKRALYVTGL
jgi:cellulose synthase operon protein C